MISVSTTVSSGVKVDSKVCSWSDFIEDKVNFEGTVVEDQVGKQRIVSGDGGLGSSLCGEETVEQQQTMCSKQEESVANASSRGGHGSSDSGQGSEADDGIRLSYHFRIPSSLCGKLIGGGGANVKRMRAETKCSLTLVRTGDGVVAFRRCRRNPHQCGVEDVEEEEEEEEEQEEQQTCVVEGTRNGIDRCLELIREKFPLQDFPHLTLDQINHPNNFMINSSSLQPSFLGLVQGVMHEVQVSTIVSACHIFVQQPTHHTYSALPRLENCMNNVYNKLSAPSVPREAMEEGLVCVVPCAQLWFRAQIVLYDSVSDYCDVKLLDYGGFYNVAVTDLKQIRSDLLALPFQATECLLGNVMPPSEDGCWPLESAAVLEELVKDQVVSARMLGVTEEFTPIVHLYGWITVKSDVLESNDNQQPRLLNRELVDRGAAVWTEHVIAV